MGTRLTFGIADNNNEIGSFAYNVENATDGPSFETAVDARGDMSILIAALSLGVLQTTNIGVNDVYTRDRSTETYAVREVAVRFVMVDNDGNQVVSSLPAPDLSKFPFAAIGQDTTPVPYAGMDADVGLMIAALERDAIHPITGGNLTVIRLDFVGRNN